MNRPQIVVFSGSEARYQDIVSQLSNHGVEFIYLDLDEIGKKPNKNLIDCVALWVEFSRKIDSDLLRHFPSLKYIFSSTTGLGHIDSEFCSSQGILVWGLNNFPEISGEVTSTPEFTWLLILAVFRKLEQNLINREITAREIIEKRELNRGSQIKGKNIGVIGFGRVGRQICNYALSFGMEVGFFDISPISLVDTEKRFNQFDTLEKLLECCDVIVIAASQSEKQQKIITAMNIGRVKQGSILINTARGSLWDEEAVLRALRMGRLAGVGVDVYEIEENHDISSSPLLNYTNKDLNLIKTPHIGGATIDAQKFVTEKLGLKIIEILIDN